MNVSFLPSICIHRSIISTFIEKKSMLVNFFLHGKFFFLHDFRFSFPCESSFPWRTPGYVFCLLLFLVSSDFLPCQPIYLFFSHNLLLPSSITHSQNVTTCTMSKWSHTQWSHLNGEPRSSSRGMKKREREREAGRLAGRDSETEQARDRQAETETHRERQK